MIELAAAVAANALRAHHVAIQGEFFLDETDEVTAARVLAHACDQLGQILDDYRRRSPMSIPTRGKRACVLADQGA